MMMDMTRASSTTTTTTKAEYGRVDDNSTADGQELNDENDNDDGRII